jgi:alkylation response protein AidB-like acyl-CoA dehydrogenase
VGFDLQPTDEQQALKQTLAEFAAAALRPAARDAEAAGRTPEALARQIQEIGVAAPVDEAYGGGGTFDAVTYCMAAEELAWGDPAIAYQALGGGLAAVVIGRTGTDEQKASHLPIFTEPAPGRSFVAVAEKVAAGDLESLDTTIEGNLVAGRKYGVLDAEEAQVGIVVGRSQDGGLAAATVTPDCYEIVKPEDKLGLEAAPTWVVDFDGSGDALQPGAELQQALLLTKLMTGAVALGCARASLEYAANYATEREAFGKPIGAFQGISFKIADMAIAVDAARAALWRTAWHIDRGTATLADAAEANGQCVAAAVLCGDDGVQVLGGHGFVTDHPSEMWFRDAVTLSVLDSPELVGDVMVARSVF